MASIIHGTKSQTVDVDRARWLHVHLPVLCNDLTLISLLLINIAGRVALFDRWTISEVSIWCEVHMPNHSRITAATDRDGVFHSGPTIPTPTVCDSVSWIVEVSKGLSIMYTTRYVL